MKSELHAFVLEGREEAAIIAQLAQDSSIRPH